MSNRYSHSLAKKTSTDFSLTKILWPFGQQTSIKFFGAVSLKLYLHRWPGTMVFHKLENGSEDFYC
jgi:hypothetical protein